MVKITPDALLENVNDADGDAEKGEDLKREELKRAVVGKKLNYILDNTLFVDSYEGISTTKKALGENKKQKTEIIADIDEELRQDEHQRITEHFSKMIQAHREKLYQEAEILKKATEQAIESSVPYTKLTALKEKFETLQDTLKRKIKKNFLEIETSFCHYFRNTIHWRSARASAMREGNWHNANIYAEYAYYCKLQLQEESSMIKSQMCDIVKDLENSDEVPESFIISCNTKIDSEYSRLLEKVQSETRKLCEESLTSDFWQQKAQQVETGVGYYDRLMRTIEKQMNKKDLPENTTAKIQQLTNHFFEEILLIIKE